MAHDHLVELREHCCLWCVGAELIDDDGTIATTFVMKSPVMTTTIAINSVLRKY